MGAQTLLYLYVMGRLTTLILMAITWTASAQESCPAPLDADQDGLIGINDMLNILSLFGDSDMDFDGIWDSVDDCVGAYDECDVCNGPGPQIPIIESITTLYDSVYAEQIDEWWVFEVGVDTSFTLVCEAVPGCTQPAAYNYDPSANVDDGSCVDEWVCGLDIEYQGLHYRTVEIGSQCWFKDNLQALTSWTGSYYNLTDDASNFFTFGGNNVPAIFNGEDCGASNDFLYNIALANDNEICPSGWHVPTDTDFATMETHLGMTQEEVNLFGFGGRTVSDLEGLAMFEPAAQNMMTGVNECPFAGVYLTSSLTGWPGDPIGIYRVFGVNQTDGQIGRWYDGFSYAASIRCILD